MSCRFLYLMVIMIRQVLNQTGLLEKWISNELQVKALYFIELFLIVFSYLSCFLNAYTFTVLTAACKKDAVKYFGKVFPCVLSKLNS